MKNAEILTYIQVTLTVSDISLTKLLSACTASYILISVFCIFKPFTNFIRYVETLQN